MEGYSIIKQVLDKYFTFCKEPGEEYSLAAMTESIPILMLDKTKPEDESGYSFWLPLKAMLPKLTCRTWKHCIVIRCPALSNTFCSSAILCNYFLIQTLIFSATYPVYWKANSVKPSKRYYATLPGRKYLPFARFRNYGVLAFNAGKNAAGNEYEIVILDHEDGYQATELYATDFVTMFQRIDTTLDEKIKQITSYRDNS